MERYFEVEKTWKQHLDFLKNKYPNYYKLKFAPLSKSLHNIHKKLPDQTTVVRYTYIDTTLYAIIITKEKGAIYKLNTKNLNENIAQIRKAQVHRHKEYESLHKLYSQLWQPFDTEIKTKKVIIIPDQQLFNLSFEMLTTQPVLSSKDLVAHSLLNKHIISYNYSLFLIDRFSKTNHYDDNFIAFVPEFSEQMKSDYRFTLNDSTLVDKTYLTLLPQPFTRQLAQNSSRLFDGISFLNENSTKAVFANNAKAHKIIHIGTHAESNNITPELSRLVFAKSNNENDNTSDNHLYTYEIYNTNLSSNLAILTACETGKPTYQPGEGMISLANAFQYAGSESILTSLWKIDEQSSAEIVKLFYTNLKNGMSKDKALQQAKIAYLSNATGRTVNPEYWAGLVLIGDTSPIQMDVSTPFWYWILSIGIFIILVFFLIKRKNARKNKSS